MAEIDSSKFPGNSHAEKKIEEKEREKQKPIVTTPVREKKKSVGSKIAEGFTGDNAKAVFNYILFDVVLPSAKTLISDIMREGTDRMLFGNSRQTTRPRGGSGSYVSYGSAYSGQPASNRSMTSISRARHDFRHLIIATRQEADDILNTLLDVLSKYQWVSVSDYYDLMGISGSFQDDKWGWYDLSQAVVVRTRDGGYSINLPRTEPRN